MGDGLSWVQWVTIIEVPVFLGVVGFLFNRLARTERDLTDFKLQVAKEYASVAYLKDVENRIVEALAKIDKRLDKLTDELVARHTERGQP